MYTKLQRTDLDNMCAPFEAHISSSVKEYIDLCIPKYPWKSLPLYKNQALSLLRVCKKQLTRNMISVLMRLYFSYFVLLMKTADGRT
jgi:hypothetical protein